MNTTCHHLEQILKLAETDDNTIAAISKSELMNKVIWMNNAISDTLRNKILLQSNNIIHQKVKEKPHDPASECFICNVCKVVIAFPL